jgi:hypothetical protein
MGNDCVLHRRLGVQNYFGGLKAIPSGKQVTYTVCVSVLGRIWGQSSNEGSGLSCFISCQGQLGGSSFTWIEDRDPGTAISPMPCTLFPNYEGKLSLRKRIVKLLGHITDIHEMGQRPS